MADPVDNPVQPGDANEHRESAGEAEPGLDSDSSGLIVGIGASAGGLEAFAELLRNLPPATGMTFVLVQHLDPHHESMLAQLLGNWTSMPVIQVQGEVPVRPDHVYVIPPNSTMLIADRTLRLNPLTEEQSHRRRPIDAFFLSLAASARSRAIGVVLSGAASDGTLGLKAIKAEGGTTFAQDSTAKFDAMPQSAIAAGIVDFILSPARIAQELATMARHPLTNPIPGLLPEDGSAVETILGVLRESTGVDFSLYRSTTIQRRLARRMVMLGVATLKDYVGLLQRDTEEVNALFDDLLIKVTGFFRDTAVFDALKQTAFPSLLKDRAQGEPLRVWVPGCSTGEEVYSIAISLLEYLDAEGLSLSVQMFGTDASERVIDKARSGLYDESIESGLSPERLKRFFTRSDAGYRINRNVREQCVFSRHNLGADPPLSHMDLVSCRNLLIYFAPVLQQRVINTLAYALRPAGCLLVGTSENSSRLADLFDPLDDENRIYCRKPNLGLRALQSIMNFAGRPEAGALPRSKSAASPQDAVHSFVDHMLLSRYGPSGLLIDKEFRIIEVRGDVREYLNVDAGHANLDLFEAVRQDLATHLRAAVTEAHQRNTTVRLDEIEVRQDRAFHFVRITVIPVSIESRDPYSVILFEDLADSAERALKLSAARLTSKEPRPSPPDGSDRHIEHLERELASSREYLQSIIEELRSSNEEAQSTNEELQSSNEELQTTKEELQASNEELGTLNAELKSRNVQLGQLNDDLENLVSSIRTAILIVGHDLRIRRFTPEAGRVLHLNASDVGRHISDIVPRALIPGLLEILRGVLRNMQVHEQEVQDLEGQAYLMSAQPYRTADKNIDGAILTLTDVSHIKRGMEEVRRARDYATAVVDSVREPLLIMDDSLAVRSANQAFHQFFHTTSEQIEARNLFEIAGSQLDLPSVRQLLGQLLAGGPQLRDIEVERDFQFAGPRTLMLNARRISGVGAGSILLAFEDVTERKRAAEARYRRLFESASDGILIIDASSWTILDINPAIERLLGYNRQELVGRKLWEAEPARETPGVRSALEQIRDQNVVRFEEIGFRTKDGRLIQTEFIGNVYTEGDRLAIQLNIRDLTERRTFERELQHTQKLESLGLLAGGIAHDFNNLLTGILGNASLLYSDLPDGNPFRTRLRNIISASERAADLTRQLLAYAGKGRFVIQPISLSSLISEILVLLQSSIPRSVEVKLDLAPDLPYVEGDAAQMQQVIMNLVINGAEAIGEGRPGTVEIRTGVRELGADEIRTNFASDSLTPGRYVLLEIKDTGSGMEEATKAKIFDPFFTTKFTGRGLGLAAVSGIVKAHRGAIRVYSTPGLGTSFYILIPSAGPAEIAGSSQSRPNLVRGFGTVLLVDDEAAVRQVAQDMLERIGFDVLVAENGKKGVDLFRDHNSIISLVVLDLTMPVMDGAQAFDAMRAIRDDVPILLASGYEDADAAAKTAGKKFAGFIHKPFDLDRLTAAVSTALKLEK